MRAAIVLQTSPIQQVLSHEVVPAYRAVYGAATAQSLLPLSCRIPAEAESPTTLKDQDIKLAFSAEVS